MFVSPNFDVPVAPASAPAPPRSSSADIEVAALPSRNIAIRAISTSKPTALASAGGITHVGQETGLTDRPARREVLLPSQERPKNVVDYALYVTHHPRYRRCRPTPRVR